MKLLFCKETRLHQDKCKLKTDGEVVKTNKFKENCDSNDNRNLWMYVMSPAGRLEITKNILDDFNEKGNYFKLCNILQKNNVNVSISLNEQIMWNQCCGKDAFFLKTVAKK